MAVVTPTILNKLYLAYFGRPVDFNGSIAFANADLATVIKAFDASQESQDLYGTDTAAKVNAIYNNLFNRDAEPAGLTYWVTLIQAGRITAAEAAYQILNGAQGTDATAVTNKLAAADAFFGALDTTPELLGYAGMSAAAAARTFLADVGADAATLTTALAAVDTTVAAVVAGGGLQGNTFTLTTSVDNFTGTSGNDTFVAAYNATALANTLGGLDVLSGGDGIDTLQITQDTGAYTLPATSISGIEKITARGVAAVTLDTTQAGISGVTSVSVTQAADATVKAASTTGVSVTGVSGAVVVDGGKDTSVTVATTDKDITIGGATVGAGKVTVVDTVVGAGSIAVDGGTDVTITATGSSGGAKTITVGNGGAATDLPSGAVVVTSNHTGVAATDVTLNAITVKGGATVAVTQTADTSKAATDTTGATLTQGAVTVVAGNATTSITSTQAASTAEVVAVTAAAGANETNVITFSALTLGQDTNIGGLIFTAAKALTAAEVAAAYANLSAGATQGSAPASNGTYTGSLTAGWTSGAVVASGTNYTVTVTSTTATNAVDLVTTAGTVDMATVKTDGSAATTAVTGVLGVINGTVTIDENATASVTTVSVDGYGNASTIGNTTTLSKLSSLTLANSGSTGTAGETDASMTVDAAGVATLALTLNKVKGAVSLDGAADSALKTLNVTTTGADSSFALTAAAVETLTVAGDKKATFSADLAALKTVTVSGSAGLVLSGNEANTLTSVNTTATTGAVTATIDGTLATYTGGAGVDTVTLATGTALTKAIDLGAGDDTLTFGAAVTGSTATLSGGAGTDTLAMTVANADALDATTQTFYTGFERLSLTTAAGSDNNTLDTVTLDLEKLGLTNYVTSQGTVLDTTTPASSDILALSNMASGGTLVIAASAAGANTQHTVSIKDAATGTADSLNLVLSSAATLNFGKVTAANVETVSITTVDTEAAPQTKNVDTLVLTADKATTVNVSGANDVALTLTGSTKVTTIDGSTLTGALTVTSLNTTSATTIKGGSGNDSLTAATGTTADVLNGGAGNDTLIANAGLNTLTGGAGNDTFVIGTASLNSSSYATITDFASGDKLQLTGIDSFQAAKVTLADTAVFQDYANAAINSVGANDAAWFQYGGNTYVVADMGVAGVTFTNSEDFIVKLAGLVDLTNASFSDSADTISL